MGKKTEKKKPKTKQQILTRSKTALNRMTFEKEPDRSMLENDDIKHQMANESIRSRRVLTRETTSYLFKDHEIEDFNELEQRSLSEVKEMFTDTPSIPPSDFSIQEDILNQDQLQNISLDPSSLNGLTRHNCLPGPDTACGSSSKPIVTVPDEQVDFQPQDIRRMDISSQSQESGNNLSFSESSVLGGPDTTCDSVFKPIKTVRKEQVDFQPQDTRMDISSQDQEVGSILSFNESYALVRPDIACGSVLRPIKTVRKEQGDFHQQHIQRMDISSQNQELGNISSFSESSVLGEGIISSVDTSCGSDFKPMSPVQTDRINLQLLENTKTDQSEAGIIRRWIENALDVLMPYVP